MIPKQVDNCMTKYKDEIQSSGTQNDSLTCFKCNKTFTTKGNLKSDMELHTERFSFYCEMCNKGFNNLNHYKTHMQAHEGIRYHCQYCSKVFASKKTPQYHLLQHTGEYRFRCDTCCEGFNDKPKFEKHVAIHLYYIFAFLKLNYDDYFLHMKRTSRAHMFL